MYTTRHPGLDSHLWKDCLWTGVALHTYDADAPKLSLKFIYDSTNELVTAMPSSLQQSADDVHLLFAELEEKSDKYLDSSLVYKHKVNTIPPKPTRLSKLTPAEEKKLSRSMDGLSFLVTDEIIATNIGSNIGLITICRRLFDKYGLGDDTGSQYLVLNCDLNIFVRVCKVRSLLIYTQSRLMRLTCFETILS